MARKKSSSGAGDTPLKGKIAVVTGASRGLGRGVAIELAKHGAKVAVVARTAKDLNETVRIITAAGGSAQAIVSDTTAPEHADDIARRVHDRLGSVSILVNAAGVFGPIQQVKDSDAERWIHTIMVNTIGPYLLSRAFVGDMLAARWGRIICFSSAASLHPPGPLNSAYGTSKVALNQMTRHLAAELTGTGVTANVIHPGDVRTDMWASIRDEAECLGPEAEGYRKWVRWVDETGGDDPRKAAALVLRLVSDAEAKTTGQFLWIDEPLQKPVASWGPPEDARPWAK